MIFVTVGTHEQPFNRLIESIDNWAGCHDEKVVIQTGYSTYKPRNCKWQEFFSYQEMVKLVGEARIVITHGGPSSFIAPLQIGKTPIVVPRKREYDEHVNNHQVSFSKAVADRLGTIIVVEEMIELVDVIDRYDEIINGMKGRISSNNAKFCAEFEKIVNEIMRI